MFNANAQEDIKIGAFLTYDTEIENVGFGLNAEFPIMGKLTIAPSFIYYLPKEESFVKVNWFEVNANVNYYFLDEEKMSVYGIGGLSYSSVKVSFEDDNLFGRFGGLVGDASTSDGRFGLNIGGGINLKVSNKIESFAELKYVIIDGGRLVLAAGVKYNL